MMVLSTDFKEAQPGGEANLETSGRPEMVSKQKHVCGDGKRERFRRYSLPARALLGCG